MWMHAVPVVVGWMDPPLNGPEGPKNLAFLDPQYKYPREFGLPPSCWIWIQIWKRAEDAFCVIQFY